MNQREIVALLDSIKNKHSNLFRRFDLHEFEVQLGAAPSNRPYHELPDVFASSWDEALRKFGESGQDALQRGILIWLMLGFQENAKEISYTEDIRRLFDTSMARIFRLCCTDRPKEYEGISDLYLKDLAICSQRMFPAGAQLLVEPHSGFPRSLIFRGGIRQAVNVARLLLHTGGNTNYYQHHQHLLQQESFSPASWDIFYLNIADMLSINPDVKGICGGSWFHDPALSTISPHLSYLRERPTQNGAFLFFAEVSVHTGALSKSKTRRALYEAGRYIPKSYTIIWPRKALMQWAERHRRTILNNAH